MKCHCDSTIEFAKCCEPLLTGQMDAVSPEALMRSRYTAFVLKNIDYIVNTTDPQTRMDFDFEANRRWAEESAFQKLEILRDSEDKNKGLVEFKAYFRNSEQALQVHHEISKFRKQAGIWYFREGKVLDVTA